MCCDGGGGGEADGVRVHLPIFTVCVGAEGEHAGPQGLLLLSGSPPNIKPLKARGMREERRGRKERKNELKSGSEGGVERKGGEREKKR